MALAATSRVEIGLPADWSRVTLVKRNDMGNVISSRGEPTRFHYHRENSTDDLYGLQDPKKGIDTASVVSAKAFGIFLAAPIYTLGMMVTSLIRIAINVSAIFWRTVPQFIKNISIKGPVQALANLAMRTFFEFPLEIAKDIWRIIRSPLYGIGMMAASLVALPCPLEGRKWLGKIEKDWHEGLSCNMDIRYGRSQKDLEDLPFSELVSEISNGKIFLLGYCMYKRGNLSEKIAGKPRFEIFEKYAQRNEPKQPSRLDWLLARIKTS